MSLLLDALQRASKEKEKAAGNAPSAVSGSTQTPVATPVPELVPPTAIANTPLEFSITPSPEPAPQSITAAPKNTVSEKIEPTLLTIAPLTTGAITQAPEAIPTPAVVPPPPPAAPATPNAAAKVKPASPERAATPLSPQVAREILYASAGNNKKPANKRLIAFGGIAVVLALSLGSLFLFQYLNTPSGLATPQLAQTPAPAPTESPATTPSPTPITEVPASTSPTPVETTLAKPVAADTVKTAESTANPKTVAGQTSPKSQRDEATSAATPTNKPLFIAKVASSGALDAAYAALNEGRLDAAAEAYRRSLRNNPDERDALLGLAHIAHRQGRHDEARAYYQAVLRQEPDHPVANAGLLALTSTDSENTVSRARDMADKNPESAAAHSALGSTLAREGLMADAQQAFFKAATLEPENPLHAYNLAVALDRLHKHDLAKNYYERALALAERSSAGSRKDFPREAALNRLEQLRSRSTAGQ
ncbi:MAG: tetratricopeptide 2 repeat protein [Proteobacteria bacterium]|nr:tetratricopeptide 2 repeat protein [Pseudomonadota bacterium]